MFDAWSREDFPAVGDWVVFSASDKDAGVIHGILPRRSILERKSSGKFRTQVIAANIDTAFVIESADRDYNLNRFERYFALAKNGGLEAAIILNKIDLITPAELELKVSRIKERFKNAALTVVSAASGKGLAELTGSIMPGKTCCFLGSSGVGKSSLINRLLGGDAIITKAIGKGTGRGKHATTNREMHFLGNGGIIIDNPGMREVGMADSDAGIDHVFDDVIESAKKCKFKDCTHMREPGCAVKAAIESGELDASRYLNYIKLKKEAEHYRMSNFEKREKDRRFGRFVKKALEENKKYEA
jgi:ribosome biogenesis GTPase